nr:hypothetical protein [Lysinibacillus timonensis]
MQRWNYCLTLLIVFLFCFIQIDHASAAPKLDVEAEIGIQNNIKNSHALPLNITVTNSGTAFSGDLVIDTAVSYSAGSALVYPLDIAEGETKTIQLYLDGLSDEYVYNSQSSTNFFYFYEDGLENGNAVDFTGDKVLRPNILDSETMVIYTLTDNSERLSSFLQLSQHSNYAVEVFHLNITENFEFTTNPKGLDIANVLVLDEVGLTHLNENQQQAIFDWVQKGGILLVGGGDQVDSSIGIFQEYLPLALSNERTTISSSNLEQLSKGGEFTGDIEIYQAEKTENSVATIVEDNKIIAATSSLGSGQIIQTTFSLTDQPLSSMKGYPKLIASILQLDSGLSIKEQPPNINNYRDYLSYEVGAINELFPSFEVSVTALVIIVLIYILIIGPILYFILKKIDRREHAWWIIPVISVALSIALFIIGAKDRLLQSQIQQTAYYQVMDGNSLSGYYIESILTNRGGDFTFKLDENTSAVSLRKDSYTTASIIHEKSYVDHNAEGTSITLKNLNYWSVQSFIGESNVPNAGNLDIKLAVNDNHLEGSVTNHFPFELKELAVWSGHQEYKIGDIGAGETINVSQQLKNTLLVSPTTNNYGNGYIYPQSKEEILPLRLEKMQFGAGSLVKRKELPVIVGWTDQALVGVQHEGNASVSSVSYIAQSFSPEVKLTGEISLGSDILIKSIDAISQTGLVEQLDEQTNQWYLEDGDYVYLVKIPKGIFNKADWKEITFSNNENRLGVSILNVQTNEYEIITEKSKIFGNDYLSEDGQVIFQLSFSDGNSGIPVIMPEIEIQGVAI